jgi:hypothetical protein
MAKSEELRLNVRVDGEDDVKQLSGDIEDLFSKVDKLTAHPAELLLTSKFGKVQGEIADLVLKLDDLDASDPEVEVTIARLNQLQGDLDAVVGKIKEVDSLKAEPTVTVDTSQVQSSMGRVRGEIDKIPRSAGGANSALANMYGNVAGEAGNVFGAIGPVNVAIGQMAEYAADARFEGEKLGSALGSMAKIVGPVALLSGALALVQKYMGEAGAEAAAQQERVKAFADALKEVGEDGDVAATALQSLAEAVPEETVGTWEKAGIALGNLSEDVTNLLTLREGENTFDTVNEGIANLLEMGETFRTIEPLITGSKENLDAYIESLEDLPAAEGRAAATGEFLTQLWQANADATENAGNNAEFFARSAAQINEALEGQTEQLSLQDTLWGAVIRDLQDGTIDTRSARDAYNQLQQMLHLTNEKMDELAQQKVEEFLDTRVVKEMAEDLETVTTKALPVSDAVKQAGIEIATLGDKAGASGKETEGFTENIVGIVGAAIDAAAAVADLSDAVTRAGTVVNGTDFRAGAIGAAFDQLDELSDLDSAEQLTNIADAFAAVDQAARDYAGTIVGVDLVPDSWDDVRNMPEDLKGITDAIGTFRDAAQVQLAEAFEFGGPEGMRRAAADMRAQFEGPFKAMMARNGATIQEQNDAWNQFMADVGIGEREVTLAIDIAIDQQKLQVLKDIASGAGLEGDRLLAFDIAIANQDPETALRILNEQLAGIGKEVVITVDPDTGAVVTELHDITHATYEAKVTAVPVDTDKTKGAIDTVAAPRNAPITASVEARVAQIILALLAAPRDAPVTAEAHTSQAEQDLDYLARTRYPHIIPIVVGGGGGGGGGGAATQQAAIGPAAMTTAGVTPLAGPSTTTISSVTQTPFVPAVQPINVTINAGVLGNHFDVERTVARALRRHQRVNGRR